MQQKICTVASGCAEVMGKNKIIVKRSVDLLMIMALIALMSYSRIGEAMHEWIGTGMFVLFLIHLWLNRSWLRNLGNGKYSTYRILQTAIAMLCLLSMLGLMASGIIMSQNVFSFIRVRGLSNIAHKTHMLCSFWGFVLMSMHLGLHWGVMLVVFRKFDITGTRVFRMLGWIIALYGLVMFWRREILSYMLMQNHFMFFDYDEPLALFFIDYAAIMGMFVLCAYYISRFMVRRKEK